MPVAGCSDWRKRVAGPASFFASGEYLARRLFAWCTPFWISDLRVQCFAKCFRVFNTICNKKCFKDLTSIFPLGGV